MSDLHPRHLSGDPHPPQVVANYCDTSQFKLGRRMGIRARAALITAVFRKAMALDMSSANAGQLQARTFQRWRRRWQALVMWSWRVFVFGDACLLACLLFL